VKEHWAKVPERGTLFALALIRWIGEHMGRGPARLVLYPITLYFLMTATTPRRGSLDYLSRVLPQKPGWQHVFQHIHCFAATILDRLYFLSGQHQRFDIRVHQGQVILDQIDSGRGCILLGAHLGSFEVLRIIGVTQCHFPLKVLMNIDHNQGITRFMNALNPEIAATTIPIRGPETLLKVKESLDQGYLIGTLGDRVVTDDKVVRCQFLGTQASFPTGPMLLAAIMQCPVILCFGLYRGGNRYDVYFEKLIEQVPTGRHQRQAFINYWTQRYVDRLAYYVRLAPYNWFNFYGFWDSAS
jgi:predicted LPLAT superfamily acyltransferase